MFAGAAGAAGEGAADYAVGCQEQDGHTGIWRYICNSPGRS